MNRISRDQYLMEVAHVVAKRGTCSRLQVGAVFSIDGRIVATGYNGAPRGMPHCTHESFTIPDKGEWTPPEWLVQIAQKFDASNLGGKFHWSRGSTYFLNGDKLSITTGTDTGPGCDQAEHAERNAIAFAARTGTALEGSDLHLTHAPCLACARSVINAGVVRVVFTTPYRITEGLKLLNAAGIQVERVNAEGGIIAW